MAKELPYFRFTPQEWQNGDISLESYAMKGLYIDVCAYYWVQDCSVTKKMLVKKFRNARKNLQELIELGILKHNHSTDEVVILYLNKQFDLLSGIRKDKQKAGKSGGLKKASNAKAELQQKPSYKDKDKDNYNNKDNILLCSISSKSELEDHNEKIAFSFWKLFKSNLLDSGVEKTTKLDKAKLKPWANHIKVMIERDKRTDEQIEQVYKFLKTNVFWKSNIQSTGKLREKFETLMLKIKQNGTSTQNTSGGTRNTNSEIQEYE